MRAFLIFLSFCLSLSGCYSDYGVTPVSEPVEVPDYVPDIDVTPESHQFGALNAVGESETQTITISNKGGDTLIIDDVFLFYGTSNFSITDLIVDTLEPGYSTEIVVTYDPETYEYNSDILRIISNDPDEDEVRVGLAGSGDAPVISVEPDYYDFGNIEYGCDDTLDISIENIGNVDLVVDDIDYFITAPADLEIEDFELTSGLLPWTLSPGTIISFEIIYTPLDEYDDAGFIEVMSDDPVTPIAISEHDGDGAYTSTVTDNFTQEDFKAVDILFVIDNSGSMNSHQTNLKNNFDSFINVFAASGVDFQIAFITTDDESFVDGAIVTDLSYDPVGEVNSIIDNIGTSGSANEKGLYYSYLSLQSGADAGPGGTFLRTDSKLVVIYISDEADYSTAVSDSEVSSYISSLKSSSNLVAAHAVAGDYPSGCSTASFGDGYYDVVSDLGGSFLSICAKDWGAQMDTLARDSMSLLSFVLSETPVDHTIVVTVDGSEMNDWSYDSSQNAVVFDSAPASGAAIDITYGVWSDCDSSDTGNP